jgi:hypothetical protein
MADKSRNLAFAEIDRHPFDGVNAAKGERNVAHFNERGQRRVHIAFPYRAKRRR